jgi:hypothetical protein
MEQHTYSGRERERERGDKECRKRKWREIER